MWNEIYMFNQLQIKQVHEKKNESVTYVVKFYQSQPLQAHLNCIVSDVELVRNR